MNYLFTLRAACLAVGLVLAAPLFAAGFAENGTINAVNLKAGYVVVDDGRFELSPRIRIYSETGQLAPLSALQPGKKISFNSRVDSTGRHGAITELMLHSSN